MRKLLMAIDLHLLIHAAPLGLASGEEGMLLQMEALAARGLLRATATGIYYLTARGLSALLAACRRVPL